MIEQLHHVCILTANIEALSERLHAALGVPLASAARTVAGDGVEMRTAMISLGNGTFLQLLEPHLGPGVAELAAGGEGALYEVAFKVSSAEQAAAEAASRGLVPSAFAGTPLSEGYATAGSGSRYLYLPVASTAGVRIELIEPAHPASQVDDPNK
jgi:catechol 2,3-dioxygenase-like lactoylglutathione lyase family enzyme